MTGAPVLDRALSPLERWYWIADRISPLNAIGRVRVTGPLTRDLLERAIQRLRLRHPALRAAIAPGTLVAGPRFVPCDGPPPVRWIEKEEISDDAWLEEVDAAELPHRFDTSAGPLWRVAVLAAPGNTFDVVLNVNHCIADGRSAAGLLVELVSEAAALHAHEASGAELAPVTALRALPPPEGLMPPRVRGFLGILAMLWFQLRDALLDLCLRPRRLSSSKWVPFAARRTRSFRCSLPPDLLDRLRAKSREEGASIHGTLAAALVRAVAEVDALPARGRLAVGSPVDFRSALPGVGGDEVGAFVGTVATLAPYRVGDPLWPLARFIKRDLDGRRRRGEPLALLHVLRFLAPKVPERAGGFLKLLDAKGPGNLCITNTGALPVPSEIGPFALAGLQGTAGLSVFGSLLMIVTTSHGRLYCNVAYVEGKVPEARARAITESWKQTLLASV